MPEYIEREALLEKAQNERIRLGYDIVSVRDIESMPAEDVTPVRHGRWIEQEKYTFGTMYDCSICGTRILDNGHSWNYCPNCGSKMDGGED